MERRPYPSDLSDEHWALVEPMITAWKQDRVARTVYRHFPTREGLIEATYRSELDAVCAVAQELLDEVQPSDALCTWMDRFIDYMTTRIGVTDAIRGIMAAGGNPFACSRERLGDAVGALLSATAAAGVTRPELRTDDVVMSLSGITMAAGGPGQRDQAGRMLDILYEGMRARP